MKDYSIKKTKLVLKQGLENISSLDINQIRTGIIEEIYQKNERIIHDKDEKIRLLEKEIVKFKGNIQLPALSGEINALNPKVTQFSAFKTVIFDIKENARDTTIVVYLKATPRLKNYETNILRNWLAKRLEYENIKIISD